MKDWDKLRTSGYLIPDQITVDDDGNHYFSFVLPDEDVEISIAWMV